MNALHATLHKRIEAPAEEELSANCLMFGLGFRLSHSVPQARIHDNCISEEADGLGPKDFKRKVDGQQFAENEQPRRTPCLRWWPCTANPSHGLRPTLHGLLRHSNRRSNRYSPRHFPTFYGTELPQGPSTS